MENSVRKREWVKTAAIIFLAVLLVLTFFSKTIMNASLPEVAAQQAASGAINARIRGSGTVEASEVYNVTIKQTRKVPNMFQYKLQKIRALKGVDGGLGKIGIPMGLNYNELLPF